MEKNGLIKKLRFIPKFMTSQTGKQIVTIHILRISQEVKIIKQWNFFGLKNIRRKIFFLKNNAQNVVGKLLPDPFLKNKSWANLWSTVWIFIQFVFIVWQSWGIPKYIETKVLTTCFYFISNFWKNKKRSGTCLPASFSA